MNIIDAIKSGKRFRMTYPVDDTYGNVRWVKLDGMIKLDLEEGGEFHFDLKTFSEATCHIEEEKIEITKTELKKALKVIFLHLLPGAKIEALLNDLYKELGFKDV